LSRRGLRWDGLQARVKTRDGDVASTAAAASLVAAASPPQIVAAKGARDEDVASTVAAAKGARDEDVASTVAAAKGARDGDVASTVAAASLVAAASPPQGARGTGNLLSLETL
jgi:hypothetical protein